MEVEKFKTLLKDFCKREIDLFVNDNKVVFLHILDLNKQRVRLSLHRMFLNAPLNVCKALALYIIKNDKIALRTIRFFAYKFYQKNKYPVDENKLETNGKCYNIRQIYNLLNKRYFQNKLKLSITWFDPPKYRKFNHFTFGSFDMATKLIRINKLLDSPVFPNYFIEYVIYHEMLHELIPEKFDKLGRRSLHGNFFKRKLKEFSFYKKAVSWEKHFFKNYNVKSYGRT